MAQLQEIFDSFTCKICECEYNTTNILPKVICKNHHIICIQCLNQIRYVCPFCKEHLMITSPYYRQLFTIKEGTKKTVQREKNFEDQIKQLETKVNELATQNKKLDKQVAKYKKEEESYKYFEQEKSVLVFSPEELPKTDDPFEQKISFLLEKIKIGLQFIDKKSKQVANLKKIQENYEITVKELNEKLQLAKSKHHEVNEEILKFKQTISTLKKQIERLELDIKNREKEKSSMAAERANLNDKLKASIDQSKKIQNSLKMEASKLNDQIEILKRQKQEQKKLKLESIQSINKLNEKERQKSKQILMLNTENNVIKRETEILTNQISILKKKCENHLEVNEKYNQLLLQKVRSQKQFNKQIENIKCRQRQLVKEVTDLKIQKSNLTKDIKLINEKLAQKQEVNNKNVVENKGLLSLRDKLISQSKIYIDTITNLTNQCLHFESKIKKIQEATNANYQNFHHRTLAFRDKVAVIQMELKKKEKEYEKYQQQIHKIKEDSEAKIKKTQQQFSLQKQNFVNYNASLAQKWKYQDQRLQQLVQQYKIKQNQYAMENQQLIKEKQKIIMQGIELKQNIKEIIQQKNQLRTLYSNKIQQLQKSIVQITAKCKEQIENTQNMSASYKLKESQLFQKNQQGQKLNQQIINQNNTLKQKLKENEEKRVRIQQQLKKNLQNFNHEKELLKQQNDKLVRKVAQCSKSVHEISMQFQTIIKDKLNQIQQQSSASNELNKVTSIIVDKIKECKKQIGTIQSTSNQQHKTVISQLSKCLEMTHEIKQKQSRSHSVHRSKEKKTKHENYLKTDRTPEAENYDFKAPILRLAQIEDENTNYQNILHRHISDRRIANKTKNFLDLSLLPKDPYLSKHNKAVKYNQSLTTFINLQKERK